MNCMKKIQDSATILEWQKSFEYFRNLLKGSAIDWDLSYRVAVWIFWFPLIGAVVIALTRINKNLYRFLLREDGVIEWTQFAFFFMAIFSSIGIACHRIKEGHGWQGVIFFGIALVMIFVTGEEISWGQRIFSFDTPQDLLLINKQGETTLHNIGEVLDFLNLIMLLIGAIGAAACFLGENLSIDLITDQGSYLFVPPFFLTSSFFVIFAYKLLRFTLIPKSGFTVTRYGEWAELSLAYGVCVFLFLNLRRLVQKTSR
jgi:hypothetical protein